MPTLAAPRAERQPARRPVAVPPDELRSLARRVRCLGRVDLLDPIGSFVDEKLSLARELDFLADRAEGAR
jgi:hypothetical protein